MQAIEQSLHCLVYTTSVQQIMVFFCMIHKNLNFMGKIEGLMNLIKHSLTIIKVLSKLMVVSRQK